MNRFVVYTAIFNDYDWLKEPVVVPEDVDFVCYTDSKTLKSKYWRIEYVDMKDKTPSIMNRTIKLLFPYTDLCLYDYSLYVDGSIMIKGDVSDFFKKYVSRTPVLMNFRHPNKDCLYTEIDYCIERRRGDVDKLKEQRKAYEVDGMPTHYGLSDNKILLRDNRSEEGEIIMKEWFHHVVSYSGRDQVCLPYVLYKNHREYDFFEENIEKNDYFETWPHNNVKWYIRSWRRFKWFCENKHILGGLIRVVDERLKPKLLSK